MRSGPLRIGQAFGPRYHVLKVLGSGGMGVVYQAHDGELGEDVALKVLRAPARAAAASVADMQRRFRAELLLARKVTHRHVIRIHDIGEIDGIKFISMPLVKGRDLAAILADGPLPLERALRYARQIASALVAVHAAGVIHRDLKPSNIMIAAENDHVLLMDFGIARPSAPAAGPRTIAGAVVGTTAYMAPEQARGENVDQRTDVYGFGLILYEMLCGTRRNLTINELLARMKAPPPGPRQLNPAIPAELDALVTRCLKPNAADRYQSSAELAGALIGLRRTRKRRAFPVLPPHWLPRAAALLAVAGVAALAYWLGMTAGGHRVMDRGRAVAARAVERAREIELPALFSPDESKATEEPFEKSTASDPPRTGRSDPRPVGTFPAPERPSVVQPQLATASLRFTDPVRRDPAVQESVDQARGRGRPLGPGQSAPPASRHAAAPPAAYVTTGREAAILQAHVNATVSLSEAGNVMMGNGADRSRMTDPEAERALLSSRLDYLTLLWPPPMRFSPGPGRPPEWPRRSEPSARAREEHWLDRLLPVRALGAPTPARAEDEFQVCYIQSGAASE